MGGRDDRAAARRARADSAPVSTGRGPGSAAAQHAAGGPGLEDALHGAPDLLAALAMAGEAQPGDPPSHALRLVSKACREAVDGAATRSRLDFEQAARAWVPWHEPVGRRLIWLVAWLFGMAALLGALIVKAQPQTRPALDQLGRFSKACSKAVFTAAGCIQLALNRACSQTWLEPMACRLARAPRLAELTCRGPRGAELEQLLARAAAAQPSAVAGVKRLVVHSCSGGRGLADVFGPGLPALLRSLAHLPGLQVRV
jgi:hypothetical protein